MKQTAISINARKSVPKSFHVLENVVLITNELIRKLNPSQKSSFAFVTVNET